MRFSHTHTHCAHVHKLALTHEFRKPQYSIQASVADLATVLTALGVRVTFFSLTFFNSQRLFFAPKSL